MGYKVGSGIDEYISNLSNLAVEADEIGKMAVYDGMAVVANAIRSNIGGIPTGTGKDGKITPEEKAGLAAGLGISRIRINGGYIDVKTGFAGSTDGRSNASIARQVEGGTSKIQKRPFVGTAGRQAKAGAEAAIAKTIEEEINKRMK